jgi:hypothetical protein
MVQFVALKCPMTIRRSIEMHSWAFDRGRLLRLLDKIESQKSENIPNIDPKRSMSKKAIPTDLNSSQSLETLMI